MLIDPEVIAEPQRRSEPLVADPNTALERVVRLPAAEVQTPSAAAPPPSAPRRLALPLTRGVALDTAVGTLVYLRGSGSAWPVTDLVYERLQPPLGPLDEERLRSGRDRWHERLQVARSRSSSRVT